MRLIIFILDLLIILGVVGVIYTAYLEGKQAGKKGGEEKDDKKK
jgi:hypothetical protein